MGLGTLGRIGEINNALRQDKYFKDARMSEKQIKYWDWFAFGFSAIWIAPYVALAVIMYIVMYLNSPFLFTALNIFLIYLIILRSPIRFFAKRKKIVKYFKKISKIENVKVIWLQNPYKNRRRPSGHSDIIVETTNIIFHVMLLPAPKKAVHIEFPGGGKVKYTTRFNQNNFRLVFNLKPKIKERPLVFDTPNYPANEKHIQKIIILCPVPHEVMVPSLNDRGGIGSVVDGIGIHNMDSLNRLIERDARAESQFY